MNLYLNYILYISYILNAAISFISTFVTKQDFDSGKIFVPSVRWPTQPGIWSLSLS